MSALRLPAASLAVIAALVVGVWFWSGVVAPGYWSSIVLGTVWFVVVSAVAGKLTKGRGSLRVATRGTMIACSLLAIGGFYWTSIRETTVDEDIVVGVAASDLADRSTGSGGSGLSPAEQAAADEVAAEEASVSREDGAADVPRDAPRSVDAAPAATPTPAQPVQERAGRVETRGHSARGRAAVVRLPDGERVLTLSDRFRIDPGPKVRVYLVAGDGSDVSDHVDLGGLKGSKGDQQYRIPGGVDLARYRTVVFWCVPFTSTLAVASLRPS